MFIPLRAQHVSLIITFSFIVAELGLLWTAKTLNGIVENRSLHSKRGVLLHRHRRRLKFISLTILLSFIGLEIFASSLSQTAFMDINTVEECLSMVPITQQRSIGDQLVDRDLRAELISIKCLKASGKNFGQKLGNISLETLDISCEEKQFYWYENNERVNRSTSRGISSCRTTSFTNESGEQEDDFEDDGISSEIERCVWHEFDAGLLYISERDYFSMRKTYSSFVTGFSVDVRPLINSTMDRYLDLREKGQEREELHVRRMLFTNTYRTNCTFKVGEVEGTEVPNIVLGFVIGTWSSILIFAVTLGLVYRKVSSADLSNPFFWARRVFKSDIDSMRELRVGLSEDLELVQL